MIGIVQQKCKEEYLDVLGIGIGPSSLSLLIYMKEAGLLDQNLLSEQVTFFERKEQFSWHPGMMLPSATMQINFLKDLVTTRNPTSAYSFLNCLQEKGRLEHFINLRDFYPSRREYAGYVSWVAKHFEKSE